MCLEGRPPALLVALASIVMSACGGGRPAPVVRPRIDSPATISSPNQASSASAASPEVARQTAGARVRGTIATPDRRPLVNGAVIMTPTQDEGPVAALDAMILPDGSFVFSNVPPGIYQIRAMAQTERGGTPLFARFQIAVRATDMDQVNLTLEPGASASGTVNVEAEPGAQPPPFSTLRVRAPFADGSSFGEALTGDVLRDGSFAIRGVMAGTHLFIIEGLPHPWVLKGVMHRGQDITDSGIEADRLRRFDGVRITITNAASEVSGTVRDKDGRGVAGALVVFVPVPQQFWAPVSRRFGRLRTDASGHYSVRGLPPGDYRAAASLELDDRDAYRPDITRAVGEAGVGVSLEALATRVLDLSLTRIPPLRRASAR